MARTIQEIKTEIIAKKEAESALNGLTSASSTAIWRVWVDVFAIIINIHEQLIETFKPELEGLARDAVAGTADWLQKRVLEFQYDADNPQVITVNDGRASYSAVDESLRIISRAAVVEQANNRVLVKAAKGTETLSPLDSAELNALISYVDRVGFVGVPVDVVSLNADRLRVEAEIFFDGQYVETTVKAAVITAIEDYLKSLSVDDFNGIFVREKMIDKIQSVAGVIGIDTLNVQLNGRAAVSSFGDSTNESIQRTYNTSAGHIIGEDTAGETLEDTITMTLANV